MNRPLLSRQSRGVTSSRDILLLFDIDGTLLDAGEHAVASYSAAFKRIIGRPLSIRTVECAGRTDYYIVRSVLELHGFPDPAEELIRTIFDAFLQELTLRVEAGERFRCLSPVEETLEWLSHFPQVRLALLTGNLEEGAWLKLRGTGLSHHFRTGAFGSDHPDRAQLGPIAIRRAEKTFSIRFRKEDIYIIGDSVHDISCSAAAGVRSIAVATGSTPHKTLLAHSPDYLLPSLEHTALSAILFGADAPLA